MEAPLWGRQACVASGGRGVAPSSSSERSRSGVARSGVGGRAGGFGGMSAPEAVGVWGSRSANWDA